MARLPARAGASFDPCFESGDVIVFQFAALRHFEGGVGLFDGFNEEAGFGIAGGESGSAGAAFEHAFGAIEPEAAERGGAVASEAIVGEDGAYLRFEVVGRSGVYSLRFQ